MKREANAALGATTHCLLFVNSCIGANLEVKLAFILDLVGTRRVSCKNDEPAKFLSLPRDLGNEVQQSLSISGAAALQHSPPNSKTDLLNNLLERFPYQEPEALL